MTRCTALSVIVIVNFCGVVTAQEQVPAFEVVSIRRNIATGPITGSSRGDMFQVSRVTLSELIQRGYGIRADELEGGPDWARTERFDVTAKAATELTPARRAIMIQRLLQDRFGLVLTKKEREGDIYTLKVARSDGRLGPVLRRAAADCDTTRQEPTPPPRPSIGPGPSVGARCVTSDDIANGALSRILQTRVIDQTGLTGKWDYVVGYGGLQSSAPDPLRVDARPDLFTALTDQLGLKLERQRGAVSFWVIDSVHQPTEN